MDWSKKIEVHLVLTEKEAMWLKSLVQNQLKYELHTDEPEWETDIRSKFWDALEDMGVTL